MNNQPDSKEADQLFRSRHSLAHLLAMAVLEYDPAVKLAIGPVIDTGFYYDFEFSTGKIPTPEDLKNFQKKVKKLASENIDFIVKEISADEARKEFAAQPYKIELIEELAKNGENLTTYTSGNFTDLCAGPHVTNTKEIDTDAFIISHTAGAYWKGDAKNNMLTRIYGLAFASKDELDAHLKQKEEALKRDHRELGKKLQLFAFDEEIGKGLPLWLPKGNVIKEELENWAKETEKKWGYQRVTTPIITKENLFYTSGHLPLYKDSMYAPITIEDEHYYIKPMNCPFHHKVFSAHPKSYKDLPLRLAEYGWCHRFEDSGSLFGLMRVRGMQMNDAHIYTTEDQAINEFVDVIKLHEYYYKVLGVDKYEMELALRDPKNMAKYHGEESDWKLAEDMTMKAMEISKVPYKVVHEGAAFYGPKMDFQIYSSIGRAFTASTNQLDLFMGKRFNLEYTDKDGSKKTPFIIHRAPLGTHERFIGFLIEHFAGAFPTWLSPVQVSIVPIADSHHEYAKKVFDACIAAGIRAEVDYSGDSLGKKIREAKVHKTPYIFVVGDKEVEGNTVSIEVRDLGNDSDKTKEVENKVAPLLVDEAIMKIEKEIKDRSLYSVFKK